MTTVRAILASAATKLGTLAPTRDATLLFKEHVTSIPFEDSPISMNDGFEIVARDELSSQGFGQSQTKEEEFRLVVRLGHAPASTDKQREEWRAHDRERIVDIFENHAWPSGTMAVFYERSVCNKERANWWLTEIVFRVMFRGAVLTS